jgi:hypothetical protein
VWRRRTGYTSRPHCPSSRLPATGRVLPSPVFWVARPRWRLPRHPRVVAAELLCVWGAGAGRQLRREGIFFGEEESRAW